MNTNKNNNYKMNTNNKMNTNKNNKMNKPNKMYTNKNNKNNNYKMNKNKTSDNKKISCGALFYTYKNNKLGVILGLEKDNWMPFKGCKEEGETPEKAAIREIKEETCELVLIDNIILDYVFETERKKYHIGLIEVNIDIVDKFNDLIKYEKRTIFKEKEELKFFEFPSVLKDEIHHITKKIIKHYYEKLESLNINNISNVEKNIVNTEKNIVNTEKNIVNTENNDIIELSIKELNDNIITNSVII